MRQKDHLNQMPIATNSEKLDISLEDKTSELAKKISISLNKADVVLLQKLNNINQTEITSPTFNLVNEYDVGKFTVQHYDLYRLKNIDEIKNIGLLENRKEVLTLIEWPEKIEKNIEDKIELFFEYNDDLSKRFLTIKNLKN